MFDKINFLRIIAHRTEVSEEGARRLSHIFRTFGAEIAQFVNAAVVFGRNFRTFDIKFVGHFVKPVNDLVEVFNQVKHIGTEVGNEVLRIKLVFDVTAEIVGIVFDLFDLFGKFFVFVAALFIQVDQYRPFEGHCRV